MPTPARFTARLVILLLLLASPVWAASGVHTNAVRRVFGRGYPFTMAELPAGQLKAKLQTLAPAAKDKGMQWLHTFTFSDLDAAEHLRVDNDGGIYIVCPDDQGNYEGRKTVAKKASGDQGNAGDPLLAAQPVAQAAGPVTANAPVPVSSPPVYHSRLGAAKIIYLDFNGGMVSNTAWNSSRGVSSWNVAPYTSDTDTNNFSDVEQTWIRRVWERIAEDYAPFNVDVTTDAAFDPDNTGGSDNIGWIMICNTNDLNGVTLPTFGVGGVAYVGVYGGSSYWPTYQPAWVSAKNGGGNEAIISEAAAHEMGHNMGLSHDGATDLTTYTNAYYGGYTATANSTSWGPIMGTGYSRNVSQWSKGEYHDANQLEDDLAIISSRVAYVADDHGDTFATATVWVTTNGTIAQAGLIGRTGDIDVFKFTTGAGALAFAANPYKCDADTWGGNLDLALELYDSTFTLIASNNPATNVTAAISANLAAGSYYLMLKPVGAGYPMNNPPDGYTAYGSLGRYTITGNIIPTGNLVGAGMLLVAETCRTTNGVIDPDETVTVQLALQNIGTSSTSNLVATLLATNGVIPAPGSQTYGIVTGGGAAVARPFTFTASGNCGDTIQAVWQLQDGSNPYGNLTNTFILGAPAGVIFTNSYTSGGITATIPDTNTVEIPIPVGDSGVISNVTINVRLNHTYDGDLILSLVHPDGTVVSLANNRGGGGDNFGSGNADCTGTYAVFDDAAGTAISNGVAPFAGSYRPETPLAALNGKLMAGTWKLRIQDTAAGDTGTVYCVQLNLARPAYVCCSSGGPGYNALLANLAINAGTLTPAFAINIFNYAAGVPYKTNSLTLTPTTAITNATLLVNGTPVVSGSPSSPISLNIGSNTITTAVVSQNSSVTNSYTLTVLRAAGGASADLTNLIPSAGTLNPIFASNIFTYTAGVVSYATTNLTVTPMAADTNATITVNGSPVVSGTPSANLNLTVGTNLVTTVVVSEDATRTNTYYLTVPRDVGSSNAYLANLVSSAGPLDPIFATNFFTYTNSVTFATGSLTVTPTAAETNAVIRVNGSLVASGNSSGSINLKVGVNLITNVVVSQNATATNIYLLTVMRGASISRWWDGGSTNIIATGNGVSDGGSGTWDTTMQNWDQGNGQTYIAWDNANANIAIFGGAAGTVTNTVDITVGGLTFTNAYTLTSAAGASLIFGIAGTISNSAAVTMASPITGTGPITKTGTGTLVLTASNSFSGGLSIAAGTVQISGTGSNPSAFGRATNVVAFTGNATLFNADGTFTMAQGIAVSNVTATFSGAFGESMVVNGPLTGAGEVDLNIFSNGFDLQFLNATNTFTGTIWAPTAAFNATLTMNSLADGSGRLKLGNAGASMTFSLSGGVNAPVVWNNRQVELAGTTGAITFNHNAPGNNTVVIKKDLAITGTGAKTFTLGGSNTSTNSFAGNITNGTGSVISLTKAGAGTWALSGTNTYSGATTVSANNPSGTLVIQGRQALSPGTTLTLFQNSSSASILKLLDDGSGTITLPNTLTIDHKNSVLGITIFVGNNGSANGGSGSGGTTGSTIAFNKLNFTDLNNAQGLVGIGAVLGANSYRLQFNTVELPAFTTTFTSLATWTARLTPTSANVTLAGNIQQLAGNSCTFGTQTILSLDGTSSGNVVTGNIRDAADYPGNSLARALQVTKTSSSSWTFSGTNTFSGGLTLSGATAGSQLNINSATALGTGTFTISGGNNAKIDNTSGANLTLTANNPQAWNNDFVFVGSTNLNLGAGAVTLSGTRSITVSANTLTAGGAISGAAAGITKSGNGTLVFNGDNTYTGATAVNAGTLLVNGHSAAATGTITVLTNATFGGTGIVGGVVRYQSGSWAMFVVGPDGSGYNNSNYMTFTNAVFMTNVTVKVDMPAGLGNGVYVLATNYVGFTTSGSLTFATNSGSLGTNGSGSVSVAGNNLVLTVSGVIGGQTASSWSYSNTGPFGYDGTAKTPTISFSGSTGTKTTNYVGTGTTTYANANAPTNVGTYFVSNTVVADVNYFGATNSQVFTIKAPGNFSGISVSGAALTVNVTNGTPGGIWTLLHSTNMLLPVAQWPTNLTGTYDGSGNLTTNIVNVATNPATFYLLK